MTDINKIFGIRTQAETSYSNLRKSVEQTEDYAIKKVVHTKELIVNGVPYTPGGSPRTYTLVVSQDGTGDYDGTTDTPINAAITALGASGGSVFVRAGTYTLSNSISMQSNIQLIGEGVGNTIFKLADGLSDKAVIYLASGATNGVIRDITCDGNRANQVGTFGYGISFNADGSNTRFLVENCEVMETQAIGIVLKGMYNICNNCIVHDINESCGGGGDGIATWGQNNTISNCTVYDMYIGGGGTNYFAVYSSDNTVQNVSIINCFAYKTAAVTGDCMAYNFERIGQNVSCIGCSSYNVNLGILALLTGGTPKGLIIDGFNAQGFKTGISGGYSDTIISNSYLYTTDATGTGIVYSSANTSTNWIISNCILDVAGKGLEFNANISRVKIVNNYIKAGGIAINAPAVESDIRGNTFVNCDYVISGNNIDRVNFSDNKVYGTSGHAVLNLWNTAYKYWQINNNYVDACTGSAFVLTGLSYSTIRGNFIKNCSTGSAIYLTGTGDHNICINNICIDDGGATQQYGIRVGATQSTNMVSDNVCTGNTVGQITDGGIDTSGSGNITS